MHLDVFLSPGFQSLVEIDILFGKRDILGTIFLSLSPALKTFVGAIVTIGQTIYVRGQAKNYYLILSEVRTLSTERDAEMTIRERLARLYPS